MTQFVNIVCFSYGSPIFGPRLKDVYNFSNAIIGVLFALPTVSYILTGPILMPFITKKFEWRANIIVGFFIFMIAGIFIGPSKVFGLPSISSPMMITGLWILGWGAAFTVIPVIPEMLSAVEGQYPEHTAEISDNFSGIFNVAGGFGQIIGPTVAGLLKDEVGFNYAFDILNLGVLIFTLAYILICGGVGSLARSFRATAMRCKRSKNRSISSSVTHHLLIDEKDIHDEVKIESDSIKSWNKNDDESINDINDSTGNNNFFFHALLFKIKILFYNI